MALSTKVLATVVKIGRLFYLKRLFTLVTGWLAHLLRCVLFLSSGDEGRVAAVVRVVGGVLVAVPVRGRLVVAATLVVPVTEIS